MTKALILTIKDWWEAQPQRTRISGVHLVVGKFTCVEPASLQFAFEVQSRNTFLDGAKLHIQETPLIAFCHRCQQEYKPEIGIQYACPQCHSPMDDIRSGRELKIDRVEYCSDFGAGETPTLQAEDYDCSDLGAGETPTPQAENYAPNI